MDLHNTINGSLKNARSGFTVKLLLLALLSSLFIGCESPEMIARREQIAAEPVGNYYIGRRYHVPFTRFWGYLRKPRQSWDDARLIVLDESRTKAPDRLKEAGSGPVHGYDNNVEYRIYGAYSGESVYDPNSNLILPMFTLERAEVIDATPGFLFKPNERYSTEEVSLVPKRGIKTEPSGIEKAL